MIQAFANVIMDSKDPIVAIVLLITMALIVQIVRHSFIIFLYMIALIY